MDALDKLTEQYKEIKIYKKQIPLTAGLMMVSGIVVGIVGLFMPFVWWIFPIVGGALTVSGIVFFFVSRNSIKKVECKILEVLNSDKIPKDRCEKAKSEMGIE